MSITLTEEQMSLLVDFAKINGKIVAKHLPHSSVFKSKIGDWKSVWIRQQGEEAWPQDKNKMFSTCHIVDIKTRSVYLYPKTQSENASIIGHEDESCFLADKSKLVPFSLTDVDVSSLDESPEGLLTKALSQISFL